ncbi:MAG: uroporphyrinogen-III synthase, partial [Planctomycetota bacterium]|nr:uroporphyrinogen-III synthase [Planctomycetota bacterium]
TTPLRNAVRSTVAGDFDLLMFTSAQQLRNVLNIADEEGGREAWLAAARRCVVVSIGPTATETLVAEGLPPDIEPEHPKMGHMVVAAGKQARGLLAVAKNRGG